MAARYSKACGRFRDLACERGGDRGRLRNAFLRHEGDSTMEIIINETSEAMSKAAALVVAQTLNSKPNAVLGLATGSTPVGLYEELVRMHREEGLDFSQVTTFNLDEYVGLTRNNPQSYHYFMHHHLFQHINIPKQNVYIPSGTTDNYEAFCQWYERRIVECGGIDLQILGIGSDGHIAFNEPSSSLGSRTRIKTLARPTIQDNARFFDKPEDVPIYAITMGVGTILEAQRIVLLASGESKAEAIAAAVEGPVTSMITASALQLHSDTITYLDRAAASKLKNVEYYDWIQAKQPGAPGMVPGPHFHRAGYEPSPAELSPSVMRRAIPPSRRPAGILAAGCDRIPFRQLVRRTGFPGHAGRRRHPDTVRAGPTRSIPGRH